MLLAEIEGNIIYYLAAAIYGVFVWIKSRGEKKQQAELEERVRREARLKEENAPRGANPNLPPPGVPGGPPLPRPAAGAEEDRMRRFLEALGVPANAAPSAPPAPTLARSLPAPARPAPPPRRSPTLRPSTPEPSHAPLPPTGGSHLPVPPRAPQRPMVRPGPAPRHPATRPRPVGERPSLIQEAPAFESLDPGRLDEPATAVEGISAEFDRLHAITVPGPTTALSEGSDPVISLSSPAYTAQGRLLRELLRSPQNLKTLLLAREVLGPPKALEGY